MAAATDPSIRGVFRQPFKEQVDFFRKKLNLPTERYDDIRKSAHDRAYIVAGAAKADLLDDLRDATDKAIARGESIGKFRERFRDIVRRHGWHGWTGEGSKKGEAWRTRVIYQTNLSTSYAAGRMQQLNDPDLASRRPYWKYIHNDTVSHPRPLHVSWSGLVLHKDDPWWQTHFPPNGWGCRCRVTAVRPSEYKGDKAPDDGTTTKKDSQGTLHTVPKGIDLGFDYAPGAKTDTSLRTLVQNKLVRYPQAISKALTRDINRYINATEDVAGFAARVMADKQVKENLWLGFVENAEQM
ncbi:phage Mu protein F like protein [Nitrosomonas nitrosa]|uniref:phage head morphogenesis protein n=1 Tax=Nitrosomonas nitrosa TaxID=52442 RepID=UPI000D2F50A9|nr:phage minor head protein [Nitrosomonas nitrosa]PTR03456.1 phage Mu protein F like protein [Nitrosomonas nitrosa]